MLFNKLKTNSIEEMLNKFAIKELIEFERFCRDNALWDQMYECYAEDSQVTISWYKGDGNGFVRESSKMKAKAPHKLNNTLVWLNGDKAVAVCMASIQMRKRVNNVDMDLTSYVRLVYRTIKEETIWKIKSLDCIYEKDCLIPAAPSNMVPDSKLRQSYANLISIIGNEGYEIDQELAGDDRPDLNEVLLAKVEYWLESKE